MHTTWNWSSCGAWKSSKANVSIKCFFLFLVILLFRGGQLVFEVNQLFPLKTLGDHPDISWPLCCWDNSRRLNTQTLLLIYCHAPHSYRTFPPRSSCLLPWLQGDTGAKALQHLYHSTMLVTSQVLWISFSAQYTESWMGLIQCSVSDQRTLLICWPPRPMSYILQTNLK